MSEAGLHQPLAARSLEPPSWTVGVTSSGRYLSEPVHAAREDHW